MQVILPGFWTDYIGRPEVQRRRAADKISYQWDRIIEYLSGFHVRGELETHPSTELDPEARARASENADQVLHHMAREKRFNRRALASTFDDFLWSAAEGRTVSRRTPSPSGVLYLFVAWNEQATREERAFLLETRLRYLRLIDPEPDVIVGIGTEQSTVTDRVGYALDTIADRSFAFACLGRPEPDSERDEEIMEIGRKYGWFRQVRMNHVQMDEFPKATSATATARTRRLERKRGEKAERQRLKRERK